ncbi:T9SS type A sorting domain-containing protein [Paludibacter sp.]|uniref:T9SS type A sorting domain-containing protein n=1 Tax=Paludibacter sp. TaxID=1898105 RepID=UPI002600FF45|nr:T9SS type A sorting domain-containing protein [Paludibacter sp.]
MQSLKYLLMSFLFFIGYGLKAQTIIWTTKIPDASALFYGIGYGNNYFITFDYNTGKMYRSTDNGHTWNTTTSVSGMPGFIAYGNNTFVATDNNQREYVYYSTNNGDTWTGNSLPTTGISMSTGAIIYGGGKFVTCSSNGSTGSIFTSTDGISWSTVFSGSDPESSSGLVINGICYGSGMYVAVGTGLHGRVFTSTNTTTWTSRSNPISSTMAGVAYGNNIFVALSNAGEVIKSTDGITWSSSSVYNASTYMNSIAFGNGYFYAVGNGGTIIKSSDGVNWTTEASGTTVDLYGITYGNGIFIATGDQGVILVQEIAPTVTTQAVSSIAATTATGNGNITDLGTSNPTAYGICWNTTGTPTTANSKADNGAASATGAFTASMTSLTANTTYYVRAFATNTAGTSYGSEVSFTTSAIAPTVTTQAVSSIAATTATGNGNITSLGVPNPTAYGVCWNTSGTPTTADSKADNGAASATGAFTASMTSLTANTTYHVRAFATNTAGTSYGQEVNFTTSVATGIDDAQLDGVTIYPNPVDDRLYIKGIDEGEIAVYDMGGSKVISAILANTQAVDVSGLAKGVYTVRITTPNGKVEKKLVKK